MLAGERFGGLGDARAGGRPADAVRHLSVEIKPPRRVGFQVALLGEGPRPMQLILRAVKTLDGGESRARDAVHHVPELRRPLPRA